MAVNLQKGQKVDLRKSDGSNLKRAIVGLGWDMALQGHSIDCDASAFACKGGKLLNSDDIVYFGHLQHRSGGIVHTGDNLTGEGEGDDEQIIVNFDKLPSDYDKIIFVVNIYNSSQRGQNFGMIQNAFIRIVDAETKTELCKYNLTENYDGMTAMIFGEIYLRNGQWKFNAIGQGTKDSSISELAARFR
ncbi:MAG: TerD family protein [Synergistaceae bacterium]|nr:TerD family protein [Synergistaceae bacterium]